MRTRSRLLPAAALPLAAVTALAGCQANDSGAAGDGDGAPLEVTISGAECPVSADTTGSGTVRFTLRNTGAETNEFEVLAEDKLRIVGERENLAPGTTTDYTLVLEPGTYYTACKPNMIGEVTGLRQFTVTDSGKPVEVSADEKEARDKAAADYRAYVRDQVGALVTGTTAFTEAYLAGDEDKARSLYPRVRMHYERIEPTAEAFGDIDPKLDLREADSQETGEKWTGWHVIEKDLWRPKGYKGLSDAERKEMAKGLDTDTAALKQKVDSPEFTVGLDEISNGAIALLEEVATTKITGEEETFSHTDLYDIQANLEGAKVAYGTVHDLAEKKDASLAREIDTRLTALQKILDGHREGADGFVSFTTLDEKQRKELSDAVNALRRPLAQLTEVVVG